ncbi:MAG: hypothetical protein HZB95_11245 [Nitrosomonadales bacterium]|nr:hypothetical protein [Nitrosomonadales bacterium]
MPTASAVTSVTSGMWQQIRSQQAQRAADQASQVARALQSQASDARAAAQQAQENARSIEIRANQAQSKADQASLSVRTAETVGQSQSQIAEVYSKLPEIVVPGSTTTQPTSVTTSSTASVGTVIDTTA